MGDATRWRDRAPDGLALLFAGSGLLHLLRPAPFQAIVPRALPHQRELVYLSGVVELGCAVGLARRTRWGGPASAALLVAVFPANVQMALDAGSGRLPGAADNRLLAWARLPLQVPLVWAALRARRSAQQGRCRQ